MFVMSQVTDNTVRNRFELLEDGETAFADYRRDGQRLYIDYVLAPLPLRGTGAAGRLMEGVMGAVRAEGLKVVPICAYAAAWIRRHRQHHDLLA
jgi:predicted GNAT family acetyltransferase